MVQLSVTAVGACCRVLRKFRWHDAAALSSVLVAVTLMTSMHDNGLTGLVSTATNLYKGSTSASFLKSLSLSNYRPTLPNCTAAAPYTHTAPQAVLATAAAPPQTPASIAAPTTTTTTINTTDSASTTQPPASCSTGYASEQATAGGAPEEPVSGAQAVCDNAADAADITPRSGCGATLQNTYAASGCGPTSTSTYCRGLCTQMKNCGYSITCYQ